MKTPCGLFAALLIAGLVPAPGSAAEKPEQMIAAAKALDAAFLEAFNAGNAAACAATYWKNPAVVSMQTDVMIMRGWEAIRSGLEKFFKEMPGAKLELTEAHYDAHGDVVTSWGMWRFTTAGPDGKPVTMEGRYSDVKARRDGKWVFIMDHISVPLPPPPG